MDDNVANARAVTLARIDGFLEKTGLSEHQFGLSAVGNHRFVGNLRKDTHGVTLRIIERAEAFMDNYQGGRLDAEAGGDAPPTGEAA